MSVYLCARYGRREELLRYAEELTRKGFEVRAEWTTGVHENSPSEVCATIDYAEVCAADIVISFTEAPGPVTGRGRGGRHVEFGVALALGKRVIVVGTRENVFHELPQVEFYATWRECLEGLR